MKAWCQHLILITSYSVPGVQQVKSVHHTQTESALMVMKFKQTWAVLKAMVLMMMKLEWNLALFGTSIKIQLKISQSLERDIPKVWLIPFNFPDIANARNHLPMPDATIHLHKVDLLIFQEVSLIC